MTVWVKRPTWPGIQVWYQPGGLNGPNTITDIAELQPALAATLEGLTGGAELVIDGQFSNGAVEFTEGIDLYSAFDVRLTNVRNVNLDFSVAGNLFYQPKSRILSDLQCTFARDNTIGANLVRTDDGNPSQSFLLKNLIWDPTTFSTSNVLAMVRSDNASQRWWFEDCSLNPDLTATTRAADRWFQVGANAPANLELNWYGPNAGQVTATGAGLMQTALSGWSTTVQYGTFTGPLISLVGISWSATAPTIVDRQPG